MPPGWALSLMISRVDKRVRRQVRGPRLLFLYFFHQLDLHTLVPGRTHFSRIYFFFGAEQLNFAIVPISSCTYKMRQVHGTSAEPHTGETAVE